MSDYGSRSYGSGSEENGWGGAGRSRGFGDSYDDYGDYAPQQRGGDSGYGDRGYDNRGYDSRGYDDRGYDDRGYGDYGDGYGSSDSHSLRSPSPHDEPTTSGRARVPGGDSTGPGRARGSARVGGKSPTGLSEEESEDLKKAKKKKKRRRRLIAMACVLVMFLGIGTVVGTVFFENVPLPEEINDDLARNSTVTFAGGKKEMGKIGTDHGNRTMVKVNEGDAKPEKANEVPAEVKYALLSMEDRNFYEHDGVDFLGVMRAFVNNVTGGETQGASTLTQQYVGTVSKIRNDQSYLRKAREAVMAMKMGDKYSKDQIIQHYMNLVYMGRGSNGLGAAAKAWFGENQKVSELTASQAAIIFAQVKAPDGSYDPVRSGSDKALKGRWKYCLKGMVDEGWLTKKKQKEYLEAGLPEVTETQSVGANDGLDDPTGFISHGQVLTEAKENYGLDRPAIQTRGYKIETTIDPQLQKIAQEVAKKDGGSAMGDEDDNLRAALVAINPRNGEVVAYYGGSQNGSHADKAKSLHPPGSSFKEVTVAAAIDAGWGPESRWNGSSPRTFPEREVQNAGEGHGADEKNISLKDATRQSLNTPMYSIARKVGANTIVKLARDMGVEKMEVPDYTADNNDAKPKVYDLHDEDVEKVLNDNEHPRAFADNEVSFGQFPVSVVDMAAVNATLASEGVYHETHFIKKITDADGNVVQPKNELAKDPALDLDVARDVTDILTGIHPTTESDNSLNTNGQQFAAKSGTWERYCDDGCNENSSISFSGYVPEIAAAAWVGDKDNENGSVMDEGVPAFGAGISGEVWQQFMEKAVQEDGYNKKGTFTHGPGGTGSKESEVQAPEDDGGDDGGDGDGGDCEENPEECTSGGEPSCGNPGQEPCDGGEPSCGNPGQPTCDGGEPTCGPLDPSCDDYAEESMGYDHRQRADRDSHSGRYAIRQDY